MKIYITLLLALIPLAGCCEKTEKKVDPLGGREIIELDQGKAYIITSGEWMYQIELSFEKNGYGIAQLSNDGTGVPPFTLISEGDKIDVSRSFIETAGGITKETVIMDRDSDGLPELRMILYRKEGKTFRTTLEKLTFSAQIMKDATIDASQAGDDNSE